MAIPELVGASLLFLGSPGETIDRQLEERPPEVILEVNQLAVMPKVLRILNYQIYWVDQ